MTANLAVVNEHLSPDQVDIIETVVTTGDLSKLSKDERIRHYITICDDLNLNWKTKPFDMVKMQGNNGPMVMYPNAGGAAQLAKLHQVSVQSMRTETVGGVYKEWVRASQPNGRFVEDIGAIPIQGLNGNALANAFKKTYTQAFRRAVLKLIGLGMSDESEIEQVPGAIISRFDVDTGDVTVVREIESEPQAGNGKTLSPTSTITRETYRRVKELMAEAGYSDSDRRTFYGMHFGTTDWRKMTEEKGKSAVARLEQALASDGGEITPEEYDNRGNERDDDDDVDWDDDESIVDGEFRIGGDT